MASIDILARKIVDIERGLAAVNTPQLEFASVEVEEGVHVGVAEAAKETLNLRSELDAANVILDGIPATIEAAREAGVLEARVVAEELVALEIATLELTADNIAANSIAAEHIRADAIDGKTITGALVQSDAAPARGIKSDTAGIRAHSPAGATTFALDAATGSLTAEGTFRTGSTGSRVELADGDGTAYARFYSGGPLDAGMSPAYLIGFDNNAAAGARTSNLSLSSGRRFDGTGRSTSLSLGADQVVIAAANGASTVGAIVLYNDGSVSLGTGGRATKGIDYATHVLTTEADGYITLAHSLGRTPAMAMAQLQGTLAYDCVVTARSASSFTIRVLTCDGTPVSHSLSVTINWMVAA